MSQPTPPADPEHRRIGVLFVCLGNICRSPAAEGCFLHLVDKQRMQGVFLVDSAGTGHWHVGKHPDPRMREAAARRGLLLPSRARQVCAADLERFDHIFTMDNENLAAVRQLAQATAGTATIEPITRFCRRHRIDEVPDPYYGGAEGFDHVLDILEDACEGLLESLKPLTG